MPLIFSRIEATGFKRASTIREGRLLWDCLYTYIDIDRIINATIRANICALHIDYLVIFVSY